MSLAEKSKREHCPKCGSIMMSNYILVRPGKDVEVFVECAVCGTFTARYGLHTYTSEDPYRSYLRMMRHRRFSSGADAKKKSKEFSTSLWEDYEKVKKIITDHEETRPVEDLLEEMD